VLPSLTLITPKHYAVRCHLIAINSVWPLRAINTDSRVPAEQTNALFESIADKKSTPAITTQLDVFCVQQPLRKAQLVVELVAQNAPTDYLLVISRRAQQINQTNSAATAALARMAQRPEVSVPGISQMVQPSRQRTRTCSPTSLAMLMRHYGTAFHPAFIDQCLEPTSSLYGVWPLNLMQASRRGFVGAVELISSWQEVAVIQAPFVASIRFGPQQLEGAPLAETAGHLVLVRGTTQTHVLCNDPAAPSADSVARHYDLAQFSRAWLEYRGATYIVVPASERRANAIFRSIFVAGRRLCALHFRLTQLVG